MVKRFCTLSDVAQAAGMSRAQVSRALRGDPGVRPETRDRIDKIAAELNYRPNLAARSLVSAHSSIVGLIIGDPNNPFHIQLAQAVDRQLIKSGFDPVTSLRSIEDGTAIEEAERLLRLRAAGVIMLATPHTAKMIGEIAEQLPCVYIGSKRIAHPRVTEIAIDDETGVRQAMEHLLTLGHKRIAHLGGGSEPSARQRTKTYSKVMEENGLEPMMLKGTHEAESGRRGVDMLFALEKPPTAIFASNDYIALGVLDRLKGMGLSVPGDVSVVGFDDIPAASSEMFSLTSIRQDCDAQALVAVRSLQELINQTGRATQRKSMPVELIVRRSTGAPRPS